MKRLLLLLLVACESGNVTPLELHFAEQSTCPDPLAFGTSSVLIQALGEDGGGQPCRLAQRCLDVARQQTLVGLETQLENAGGPLLDVETGELVSVRVLGHANMACTGEVNLCGEAQLPATPAPVLDVPVACEVGTSTACDGFQTLPACP
jgi:hypothetical protein